MSARGRGSNTASKQLGRRAGTAWNARGRRASTAWIRAGRRASNAMRSRGRRWSTAEQPNSLGSNTPDANDLLRTRNHIQRLVARCPTIRLVARSRRGRAREISRPAAQQKGRGCAAADPLTRRLPIGSPSIFPTPCGPRSGHQAAAAQPPPRGGPSSVQSSQAALSWRTRRWLSRARRAERAPRERLPERLPERRRPPPIGQQYSTAIGAADTAARRPTADLKEQRTA